MGLVYLAVIAALPKHVFWSPDEGIRYMQMRAIGWGGGLAYALPYPGRRLDPDFRFYPSRFMQGRHYPTPSGNREVRFHWSMWFPLLSRPFFGALGIRGLYLVPLLAGLLTALLAGWLSAELDPRAGPAAVLLVGLGTPVFFYSLCFWEHTLATLFAFAAVVVLALAPAGSGLTLLVIAPVLLIAVMLRLEMVTLASAAVLSWLVCRIIAHGRPATASVDRSTPPAAWRRWLPPAVTLAALVLLLFVVPGAVAPRHREVLAALPQILWSTLHRLPTLPESLVSIFINFPSADGPAAHRAWEAGAFLAAGVCFIAPLYRPRRLASLLLFPSLLGVLAFSVFLLVSNQRYGALHGVIPVAPYMVVAGYAWQAAWHGRDDRLLALVTTAFLYMVLIFLAVFVAYVRGQGVPHTGLEWGPRYWLVLYPMMAVLALLAWRTCPCPGRTPFAKFGFRAVLVALMLVAVGYQIRGVAMLYRRRSEIAAWNDVLRNAAPIVTDVWWLPTAVAPLFVSQEMYSLPEREDLSEWLDLARTHGVTHFTFASLAPLKAQGPLATQIPIAVDATRIAAGMSFSRVRLLATAPKQRDP